MNDAREPDPWSYVAEALRTSQVSCRWYGPGGDPLGPYIDAARIAIAALERWRELVGRDDE